MVILFRMNFNKKYKKFFSNNIVKCCNIKMIKHIDLLYSAIIFWCSSLIILSPNFVIYAQSEDSQAVPSDEGGQVVPSDDGVIPSDDGGPVVQSAEGEPGKIRCSNGSLVERSTECPPSDRCPSSTPSINDILQCTLIPILQGNNLNTSLSQVGNSKQFQNINITTNKKSYKPGEVVNITIKNTGAVALTFPNSILGLTIESEDTREKYPLFSAQVITTLDSGGEKSLKWDQKDSFGQQVKEGNYTGSTSSGLINSNTTFFVGR